MKWGLVLMSYWIFALMLKAYGEPSDTEERSGEHKAAQSNDVDDNSNNENSTSDSDSNEEANEESNEADEEITVYGKREVDRRRNLLDNQLEDNGYRTGKRKGDKVVYRPETVWHPSVIVYDSGWVDLRKTPPRFEPWIGGNPDNKWRYLSCIPPFGLMCIKASGWLITKRRAQHSKTNVIDTHISTVQYWQESVVGLATQQRLNVQLPDELDEIWTTESITKSERLELIVSMWSTRTCTPEGQKAAGIIAEYIEFEIHPEHPMPNETLSWMQDNNLCEHPLAFAQ